MSNLFDDAGFLASVVVVGTAFLGLVAVIGRKGFKGARRVAHFLNDFNGTPARPGVDAQPGVMARLQRLDENQGAANLSRAAITRRLDDMQPKVNRIHYEMRPNGGDSINDKIDRVATVIAPKPNA